MGLREALAMHRVKIDVVEVRLRRGFRPTVRVTETRDTARPPLSGVALPLNASRRRPLRARARLGGRTVAPYPVGFGFLGGQPAFSSTRRISPASQKGLPLIAAGRAQRPAGRARRWSLWDWPAPRSERPSSRPRRDFPSHAPRNCDRRHPLGDRPTSGSCRYSEGFPRARPRLAHACP